MNKLANVAKTLNADFLNKRGKHYLCPDGVARKLLTHGIENDRLTLAFVPVNEGDEPMEYAWPTSIAELHFKPFQPISQNQAQGHTPLPPAAVSPLPAVVLNTDALDRVILFIDPTNQLTKVSETLMETMDKLRNTPAYIPQAQAINEVAKTVIDIMKTRTSIAKSVLGIKQAD